jgi:two-component system phosphate regulon response regulator PhoB
MAPGSLFPNGDKVLLADVDEGDALQLSSFLELNGFTVRRGADIHEAMEQFINFQPGVVIVDANLPAKSWIELIQSIRRYEEDRDSDYRSIILVTSSRYTTELSQKAIRAGAHEVVGKPLDQPGLLRRITEHAAVY